jgi:prepilin-type N-terminal cleavage/methylation domain-containing protein
MVKLSRDNRGVTLVELLVVVVILSIIATVSVIAIGNIIQNQRDKAFVGNAYMLVEAARLYLTEQQIQGQSVGRIPYQLLVERDWMEELIDPYTSTKLNHQENHSYVSVKDGTVEGVCLKGHTKNLCFFDGSVQPIPLKALSVELIREN